MSRIKYNYHIVDISPYPLYTSISVLILILNTIIYINKYNNIIYYSWLIPFLTLFINSFLWWNDIIKEALFKGEHNSKVQKGLNLGFLLFIVSEFLIFGSFFFAFFYLSMIPDILLSSFWPPKAIITLSTFSIPFLNTALLFFSGFSITAAQYILSSAPFSSKDGLVNKNNKNVAIFYILITLFLAYLFILFQAFEYFSSPFTINDSVYGSLFFLLTGFHGFHVIIGFFFILFALFRLFSLHFSDNHFLHFSFSSLYYHFVDLIWIFLFLSLYLWAN